jgi:hypothetical protein
MLMTSERRGLGLLPRQLMPRQAVSPYGIFGSLTFTLAFIVVFLAWRLRCLPGDLRNGQERTRFR